ncbi:hypothetical protein LN995_20020 [Pontibacter silvestris]|nr:hypothetical protein [Pontibacter silvestris]MCC9138716.1 hypothetical protein [Pontibacter silvestris]
MIYVAEPLPEGLQSGCGAVAFCFQTCCQPRVIGKVLLRRIMVAALVYPVADSHRLVQVIACLSVHVACKLLFLAAVGTGKAGIAAVAVGLQGVSVVTHQVCWLV